MKFPNAGKPMGKQVHTTGNNVLVQKALKSNVAVYTGSYKKIRTPS